MPSVEDDAAVGAIGVTHDRPRFAQGGHARDRHELQMDLGTDVSRAVT
jgi:hypothetical protein